MAMNQKQRDYFVDRVKSLTKDKINALKALHAGTIQEIASEKYDEFLSALGLDTEMNKLKLAEEMYDEQITRIEAILDGLSDIHPDGKTSFYNRRSNAYLDYDQYLNKCCRAVAKKDFYNTEAGEELKSLEETQREAVDTIMMDGSKVSDLTLKLQGILGKNGIQLLVEGAQ